MPDVMKRRRLIAGFLLVVLVSACGEAPPPAAPTGPSNEDIMTIRRMDAEFRDAVLAKNWDAIGKQLAERAVMMPPNAPLVAGAGPIVEWFRTSGLTVHEFNTSSEAIGGSGNLAVNRGSYRISFSAPGATTPTNDAGKYVWVLQRQPDQTWRVTLSMWNSDAAPAAK